MIDLTCRAEFSDLNSAPSPLASNHLRGVSRTKKHTGVRLFPSNGGYAACLVAGIRALGSAAESNPGSN